MATQLDYWAAQFASRLRSEPKRVAADLKLEAQALRDGLKKTAPRKKGRLVKSIYAKDATVITYVGYATRQDAGGRIAARRVTWLTIPVRPGYRKNGKNFYAVTGRDGNQYIFRKIKKGRPVLWAIRRRAVFIPATNFMARGLAAHLAEAPEREAARIEARLSEVP